MPLIFRAEQKLEAEKLKVGGSGSWPGRRHYVRDLNSDFEDLNINAVCALNWLCRSMFVGNGSA